MEWITILKCPITNQELRALTPDEISSINQKAENNQLWQADGKPMHDRIDNALMTLDGAYIYPIVKGIVILLKDLALIDSPGRILKEVISEDKQLVKNFYDQTGWITNEEGNYEDAVIFEDLRPFTQEYIKKCHNRVSRFLKPSGTYLLDAGSGALQFSDYLQYSENYKYRICVDFSFTALKECKKKLGDKALCVLADIAHLPIRDGVVDSFVSLNTVYHIPKDEQVIAIEELYRSLANGGKGVVVYEWFKHSPWMNFWMLPFRGVVFIKNRIMDSMARLAGKKAADRRLYFYAYDQAYFQKNLPPFKLRVWRTLSVHFMRYYLHSWLFGKKILDWVYNKEEKEPEVCGLKGEYPMLVFEK